MDSLTRSLALEWGHFHIRVNGIAPGPISGTAGDRFLSCALLISIWLNSSNFVHIIWGWMRSLQEAERTCHGLAACSLAQNALLCVVEGKQGLVELVAIKQSCHSNN